MDHVGMDLGKKESQIAIITEAGELVEKRMRKERERLLQDFKDRPKAKMLIEASTISEWVARLLEGLGHEVLVADASACTPGTRSPRPAPGRGERHRRQEKAAFAVSPPNDGSQSGSGTGQPGSHPLSDLHARIRPSPTARGAGR